MAEYLIGGLLALIAYFLRGRDTELKSNTQKMHELTISITKLNVLIELIMKRTDEIPEIKKDVDNLGQKFRDMKN